MSVLIGRYRDPATSIRSWQGWKLARRMRQPLGERPTRSRTGG